MLLNLRSHLHEFRLQKAKARQRLAPAGFSRSWYCCLGISRAELRRHARHVMMVVMTMMDANLHL
jgi:hypothetical protein